MPFSFRSLSLFIYLMMLTLGVDAQLLLTPEDAIKKAIENNLELKVRANYYQIADNLHQRGEAGYLPALDVYTDYMGRVDDIRLQFLNGETLTRNNAETRGLSSGLAFSWLIFDGMNRQKLFTRLGKEKDLEQLLLRQQTEELIQQTIHHYYDIVRLKAEIRTFEYTKKVSKERVEVANERFQTGVTSRMEYLQALVDYHTDSSLFMRAEQSLEEKKVHINRLMNEKIDAAFSYLDTIVFDALPAYRELVKKAEESNTSVLLKMRDKELSELDLGMVRGSRMPRLSVGANYGFAQSQSEAGFVVQNRNLGLSYGVNLSFNLFDGFTKQRAIKNAEIMTLIREFEVDNQKQGLQAELKVAFSNYQRSREIWLLERKNLNFALENLDLAADRFRLGVISGFEFREIQKSSVQAEFRLIQAAFDLKMTEVELQKLAGDLLLN
jgi:outer membrane protein TolC